MDRKLWVSALHQLIKDFLINKNTVKPSKIVQWEINFNDLAQRPEGLFFSKTEKELTGNEIHSLEVADLGIALNEGM